MPPPWSPIEHLVVVRPDSGRYTAQLAGVPEIQATAATPEEAVRQVNTTAQEWLASGRLVAITLSRPGPWLKPPPPKDPNDPLEREYLDELARLRKEDLEKTCREDLGETEKSQESGPMKWFGHARDDPGFEEYLEEIRRFRQEVDDRARHEMGEGECSDSSSTPTT
jgi:hypothetical protein